MSECKDKMHKNIIYGMKIFCVIVLYNPNWNVIAYNLKIMSEYIDKIVLWDNSPSSTTLKNFEGAEVLSLGKNIGLSRAYTEAWKIASAYSYDYFMTVDQDSQWNDFPKYILMMKQYEEKTMHKYHTLYFISTLLNSIPYAQISCGGINSGAIVPMKLLNETNGYNIDFFIDAVDDWLIAEARKRNFTCVRIGTTYIIQKYGSPKCVRILWKTFTTNNYSPMRMYGIIRNYLILFQDYDVPAYYKKECIKKYLIIMPIKIILTEKNKWKKIKAICYGVYDGLRKHPSRIYKFM